ncbi:Hypothetical predicted protein [Lecanosticta acicola]|uniref:NmrA-like domain-containing protein n=1 Tax=Lecanosticta acicola TaxID=111012 RepID=A0AAI8YTC3_9PEZI|nr:Hypothetical predicted protein [Lecanosticta acicola]
MKVAIAGAGDLGHYIIEELLAAKHEVVVLSRTSKPWLAELPVDFRSTDYSVADLTAALHDCDGLVSAILDYTQKSATVHLALLEACRRSPKCKRYIPSEYGGNIDEYPQQPTFYYPNHEPVRAALRQQKDVMWTLFNPGWLTDYLIPPDLRYIKDIGLFHPVDLQQGTVTIPGDGEDGIAFTPSRDVAKALARLFSCEEKWEETIYVCGETTTWNHIAAVLQSRYGRQFTVSYKSRDELEQQVAAAESEGSVLAAQFGFWSISGASKLPQAKLERHKENFFRDVKFRTVEEFLDDAERMGDAKTPAV